MKYALLVFFAAGTLAAPFWVLDEALPRTEIKDVGCKANRFRQGRTYVYDYAGETLNNIEGTTKQSTGLQLKARVFITTLAECRFSMQLGNAELLSKSKNQESYLRTPETGKFKKELEQNELLFTMSGNKIYTLQAPSTESTHVLNIKRGILSTLQLDEAAKTETDVNGNCEVEIKSENGKIIKTKNLAECSNRAQNEIGIQTATIKTDSSMKPLASTSKCTYIVSGGEIQSVSCDESHLFRPFSAGYKSDSGAMTIVKQEMKYVKEKSPLTTRLVTDMGVKTTLLFDHTTEETASSFSVTAQADQIMESLVSQGKLSAKQESAHEFTSLVFLLRKMDQKRMKFIWDKYFDCIESKACGNDQDLRDVYRQYLLDAVAYCGTSNCISMVRNVIIDGEVSGERMNMFLQSIALVGKTTKQMINNVLEIVKKRPSRQAYLTLGTLISRHCGKVPEECDFEKSNPISRAEIFLESKLENNCGGQKDPERVEEILMALKSIGNAKRPIRIRSTLIRCAKRAKHANITRAAFDAFRGMPCDGTPVKEILEVATNEEIDPEIRIHAFITLMKCPSEDVLSKVVTALENEPCQQVGSFIWSHLTNIMESSDPMNKEAKAILERLTKTRPLREMNLPFHKFSKSYEKSLNVESLNSGATVGGQVIFRPDGYFPKSALVNLTANVLGTPVHIIEAAISMDGIESFIANTMDIIPDNFIFKLWNHTLTSEKLKEMSRQNQRQRRSTKDKLGQIHERVNMKAPEPTGSFSIKVMGQEMRVMSYDDIFWMIDQIDNMNVVQLLMNLAKGGHKTFSKSMMFLEMTHTVPTSLGLPLKLKLVGSTVATVELDGKFDIRNMFWGPGSLTINGYVKPSAVVELSGQMGIESQFVSSGIFVNSSMFFSNMMKGSVVYKEGQMFKINVDTPEEPIQLFNFSSTPFMYMNQKTDLIEGTPRKINPDFCYKSEILGYGLCTSLRLPVAFREYEAPYFPLSGPAHFGMQLVRGDDKLTTYQFLVTLAKKASVTTGQIEFSTPGAVYERKLNGKLVYSDIDNTKTLVLSTERYGKRAEIDMSYNCITHRAALETRNNFFTTKDIITRLVYFNQTNLVSKQFGVLLATEYDWYKFEHVTKYVQKETGHMVHSSTTYYPKKSVTGVVEYNTKDQKLTARLDSEQLKQAVEISGQWVVVDAQKGINLTATHISSGKTASLYAGINNKDDQKEFITTIKVAGKTATNTLGYYKQEGRRYIQNLIDVDGKFAVVSVSHNEFNAKQALVFNANILGRKAFTQLVFVNNENEKSLLLNGVVGEDNNAKIGNAKIGFYSESGETSLKFEVDVNGRKSQVFVTINSAEGYRATMGGNFGKYIAGLRGNYNNNHNHGKNICASMYYGTETNEKEPMLWCIKYHTLGTTFVHNRLTISAEMKEMEKTAEIVFDFEKHTGHMTLAGKARYNNKDLATNTYSLTYSDYKNAELKMDVKVNKYISGWKVYTETTSDSTNFGMQAYAMDKTVLFLNRYVETTVGKTTEQHLKSQLIINGNPIPVSTEFTYLREVGLYGPSIKLNIGKYTFTYATVVSYSKIAYGYGTEFVATKGDKALVKIFQRSELKLNEKKELSQKFGLTAFGKTYEYGWEAAYENRGSVSKTAHAVTFAVQYATTRKSAITFTFANGKQTAEVLVDFEYIPTKYVSHFIRYTKVNRQLDISVEFLPKMFAKFMARLDKIKGYSLTTDMSIEWNDYKRSMNMVNSYTNTDNQITLSTNMGKDITFGATYTSTSPRTVKLFADVFNYNGKVVVVLTKRNVQLRVIANNRMLVNLLGDYNKAMNTLTFSVSNAKATWFKTVAGFNMFTKKLTLSVQGTEKRQWFQVNGSYSKKEGIAMFSVLVLEKEYFKTVGKLDSTSVSLTLSSPQLKRDVIFKGSVNKDEKSVKLCVESAGNVVGITLRGDLNNYILRVTGFVNKMESGMKMHLEKHALVSKVMFTPTVSAQVIFEVQDDKILKMTVQRTIGDKDINETSFVYKLNKGLCQLMFKWNPETITKFANSLTDLIKPIVTKVMKEMNQFSSKAVQISKKFVEESARDSSEAALNFLNKMDQSFDEFDFVGVRDKVGEVTLESLRRLSELIRKALTEAAKGLDTIKENIPEWIHKSKELSAKAKELVSTMKFDLEKNMAQLNNIVMKFARNLTESTRPVINKAIELIKDFKFRGKTVQELTILAKEIAQKYMEIYTQKAKVLYEDIKVKSIKYYNDAKVYVLKLKVPYRDETVEEVIEITLNKALDLKKQISDVDMKELIEKVRVTVMNYNIQGKPVKEHMVILRANLKDLPEVTRKAILELIRLTRVYAKEVKVAYNKVVKFAEPATNHVKFVVDTIVKHFGPEFDFTKLARKIYAIELPTPEIYLMKQWERIEKFVLPLVEPMTPLYKNLMEQMRSIKIMGFRVGPLFDIQMQTLSDSVDSYMKTTNKMLKEQMDKLEQQIKVIVALTPEEMVNKVFESSSQMTNKAVQTLTKMYKEREATMKKIVEQIKQTYQDMKTQYTKMTSRSMEETMEVFIHQGSERLIEYTEELSSLLKQLAGMDIAGPSWKAWKQADVIGHLRSYGVNDKIMTAIQTAKDVKVTELVLNAIKVVKEFITDVYTQTQTKALQTYNKALNVVKYIKSIPKKEYEEWYNELKDFTLTNKQSFVEFVTKTYKISEERARKLYDTVKKMSLENFETYKTMWENVGKDYIEPAKEFYNVMTEKSVLVYNEVKQPTIDVTNHYKNIVTKFAKENYDIIYERLMKEYTKVSKQIKEKYAKLNKRMEEEYEKFLNTYGDMTWEEIGEKAYKYGEEKTELAQKMIKEYTEKSKKLALKLKKQAEELYKEYYAKAMAEYKRYKMIAEEKYMEIKPKVLKMYNDYKTMAETQYLKALIKVKEMYSDVKGKATEIYNNNKDKTLKALYIEIKTILTDLFNKQYKLTKTLVNKKTAELKTLINKYYTKADTAMRTIILPELKMEAESLINQTLRCTVILANETVEAFHPHFVLIKDSLTKAGYTMKTEALVAYKKSVTAITKIVKEQIKLLKELLVKIQNHEVYQKVINHKYVLEAIKKTKEMIKITQDKIEELKTHPTTLKYKKQVETKIAEYKQQLTVYQAQIEKLYKEYSKHPNVVKALEALKQLKKSSTFTYNQLTKIVIPQIESLTSMMNIHLNSIPNKINKAFVLFRQQPEEAFWLSIRNAIDFTKNENNFKVNVEFYKNMAREISEMMLAECFDQWTKDTTKKLYNDAIESVKTAQQKLKELPEQVKQMAIKVYNENMEKITTWTKEQYKTVKSQWKDCPYSAIVHNQLWKELADEFMSHELVDLTKVAAEMTRTKFVELKALAKMEFAKQRVFVEKKFAELRTKAMAKYEELKEKSIVKYNELVTKYNELIKKAERFVEETTIADIVEFTRKQYNNAVRKAEELKEKLMELRTKYTAEAKRLYAKYETEAKLMYKKTYAKAEALVLKYKQKLMPYYEKGMKVYNKYRPIVMTKYEEMYNKAEILYNKAEAKYQELRLQAMEKYEELKVKSTKLFAEYKEKAKTMVKTANNKWMASEIRSRLIALKKMSIRQTIEAIKKLPKQTRELVLKTYKLAVEKMKVEYEKLMQKYQELIKKVVAKRAELMKMIEPYTTPAMEVYRWIENEITETAVFIYRYHKLAERYNQAKKYITSEYKRITPMIPVALEKYAKQYKALSIKYATDYSILAKAYAEKMVSKAEIMAAKAGHGTLRGIHSTLRYIDNIDINDIKAKGQEYLDFVKKYITIDTEKGEFIISIPCGATPSFDYHIKKVQGRVRRSVKSIQEQSNDAMMKIKSELESLKVRATELKNKLQQQLMENTVELRKDIALSYTMNKRIAQRVYINAKIFAQKSYNKAIRLYQIYRPKAIQMMQKAKTVSKVYYEKFLKASEEAFLQSGELFWETYNAGAVATYNNLITAIPKQYAVVKTKVTEFYKKHEPTVKKTINKYMEIVKEKATEVQTELKPYYTAVEKAIGKVRNGMPMKSAFFPIYREIVYASKYYKQMIIDSLKSMKTRACVVDAKLCVLVKESVNVHRDLFEKYSTRASEMVSTSRAHGHRFVRLTKDKIQSYAMTNRISYNDVAMIFGNDHILTFDNKFYDIPKIKNPECSYLLAHDFANGKFSMMKQKNGIVITTPEMSITIRDDGTTKTTFGNKVITSLPVEFGSTRCVRRSHKVICHFEEEKISVSVNLKYSITRIAMSGWHFGKSMGLLGSNNREAYDDWKLPNGKVTKNVFKFVNEYETTGNNKCRLRKMKPKCQKEASPKCEALFNSDESPFAKYFKSVDPKPFLEACQLDTTDCKEETTYCGSAVAFVSMARARANWISHLPECMTLDSHLLNEEWTQKPLKSAVDVVFMMSQRRNVYSSRKQVSKVVLQLNRFFKRQDLKPRYALIGFGGNGIHERAHSHPIGTGPDLFGTASELSKEISAMPYEGTGETSNDAYHAILAASKIRFRPGASKIFIMFNTEPHSSHEQGPAYEEALYLLKNEADAALFVFDKFNFKHVAGAGKIIGQTARKLYTTRHITGLPERGEFPQSEFTTMAKATNGGWFSSRIQYPKQVATSMFNAISYDLKIQNNLCKVCKLEETLTDVPRAVCKSSSTVKC